MTAGEIPDLSGYGAAVREAGVYVQIISKSGAAAGGVMSFGTAREMARTILAMTIGRVPGDEPASHGDRP